MTHRAPSTMLADFGAHVVKVEPPGTGDISRAWGPPFYGSKPAYFVSLLQCSPLRPP